MLALVDVNNDEITANDFDEFKKVVSDNYSVMDKDSNFLIKGDKELLYSLIELWEGQQNTEVPEHSIKIHYVNSKPTMNWGQLSVDNLIDFIKEVFPPISLYLYAHNCITLWNEGKRIQSIYNSETNIIKLAAGYNKKKRDDKKYMVNRRNQILCRVLHELHAHLTYNTSYVLEHSAKEFVRDYYDKFMNYRKNNK